MRQKERKSAASNIVDIGVAFKPPEPPPGLVPEAKWCWTLTVGAFSPESFTLENLKLLERYCRAFALGQHLFKALASIDLKTDLDMFAKIHSANIRNSKLMVSLGTKLRIFPSCHRSWPPKAKIKLKPATGSRSWREDIIA
jgi:hypothetical protein